MINTIYYIITLLIFIFICVIIVIKSETTNINYENYENYDSSIRDKKIVVCFMVRNGEKYLYNNIRKLDSFLYKNFNKYHILYIENDSTDNTRNILRCLENEIPMSGKMLNIADKKSEDMCDGKDKNCNKRTRFLASLRQKLIDIIKQDFTDFDYMLMNDMDFIDFNEKDLKSMFGVIIQNNYDSIFPMSISNNKPYDIGAITNFFSRFLYTYFYSKNNSITKVNSAFSGFGIYSIKRLLKNNSSYDINNNNIEHIKFNEKFDCYIYNNFCPVY